MRARRTKRERGGLSGLLLLVVVVKRSLPVNPPLNFLDVVLQLSHDRARVAIHRTRRYVCSEPV